MFNVEDKGTKMSPEQKEILVGFMEDHPEFAKGKLLGHDSKQIRKAMWEVLTTQLNSVSGPNKTSDKWQRVWIDLKNKTKKKASKIKSSQTGGQPIKLSLIEVEKKIINIIGQAAVYGLESSQDISLDSKDINLTSTCAAVLSSPSPPIYDILGPFTPLSQNSSPPQSPQDYSALLEDHKYFTSPVQELKSRKRSESQCTSSSSDSHTRRSRSARVRSTTEVDAAAHFEEIVITLDRRMESIESKLDQLINEKKETNNILKQLVNVLENKNK